jgi:SAM-dependent methyltransferase
VSEPDLGQPATEADRFLRDFHARHPGATSRALARGRLDDGRSTYDLLADLVAPGQRVLDLGCGDGYLLERLIVRGHAPDRLAGIDLSAEELAAARERPALAGVALAEEDAAALSAATGAFDVVLSHLAFMLMSDLERVAAEVARVLAPDGLFATVVGGGPGPGDAFERFLELLGEEAAAAGARAPRLGDRRARDAIGLGPVLGAARLEVTGEQALPVHLGGDGAAVWASLAPTYEVSALPPARIERLRARFLEACRDLAAPDGVVPCTMRIRLVQARPAAT